MGRRFQDGSVAVRERDVEEAVRVEKDGDRASPEGGGRFAGGLGVEAELDRLLAIREHAALGIAQNALIGDGDGHGRRRQREGRACSREEVTERYGCRFHKIVLMLIVKELNAVRGNE